MVFLLQYHGLYILLFKSFDVVSIFKIEYVQIDVSIFATRRVCGNVLWHNMLCVEHNGDSTLNTRKKNFYHLCVRIHLVVIISPRFTLQHPLYQWAHVTCISVILKICDKASHAEMFIGCRLCFKSTFCKTTFPT